MNSFRFLERGIEAELERQRELIEAGGTVEQETLHFDPRAAASPRCARRRKPTTTATSPSPTWSPIAPTEADAARGPRGAAGAAGGADRALRGRAGPRRRRRRRARRPTRRPPPTSRRSAAAARRRRAARRRQLGHRRAGRARCAQSEERSRRPTPRSSPEPLAALVALVEREEVSHGSGKTGPRGAGRRGRRPGGDRRARGPRADVRRRGELEAIVAAAIEADPEAAEQIRAGNGKAIGAIVGAVMRETKGRADGGEVNRLIREQLGL